MILSLVMALALLDGQDRAASQPKAAAVAPAPKSLEVKESCAVLAPGAGGSTATPFAALSLLSLSPDKGLPALPVGGVTAIRCDRSVFGIGSEDYRVLAEYRLPLIIVGGGLAGALEVNEGALRFRMLQGALTEQDAAAFRDAINAAESKIRARMSPASPPAGRTPG